MDHNEIITYFNDILSRLEAQFYHEIGLTAVKKLDLAGIDLLLSKDIKGDSVEQLIRNCIKAITSAGIAKDISFSIHGKGILLKLEVDGCIHLAKETNLKAEGVKPYMCPIANMIGDRIIEVLKYETTYMAEMDIHESSERCTVKYAIFESIDKIGQVSDWTKI